MADTLFYAAQRALQHRILPRYSLTNLVPLPETHHGVLLDALVVYDDHPSDDEQLCVLVRHNGIWYVAFQGHTQIYTQRVGDHTAITPIKVKTMLQRLWQRVIAREGSLRRQQ